MNNYIWETKRWEIYISSNKEQFKYWFEISSEEVEELQSDDWKSNKERYKKKFEEIISIICP